MNNRVNLLFKTFIALVFYSSTCYSQLTVITNLQEGQYEAGDMAEFIITSDVTGTATWTLKYDPFAPIINSGTISLTAGIPQSIMHIESDPGVVLFEITQSGNSASVAALFSPYDIMPFESIPMDLDTFWENKKQDLSVVPMNPVVTYYDSTIYSKTYRVTLDNIDGRKIYGYLSVPTSTGPYPAVIVLPPYGDVANITTPETGLAERAGVLTFSVSIHNVPPDQQDPNAYIPDVFADQDSNYYKLGLLGAVRAIDYIFTRSDFDGQNVGVTGVSQGGGLSLCLSGIDDRINLLMYSVPALCQNSGLAHDKAGGFPNYVNSSRISYGTQSHEDSTIAATRYYDGMFLAQKCNYPVMAAVSYRDNLTPAATGLAAFNQLPDSAPRIMIHSINLGHNNPAEFFQGRYDFIHRYFPSTVATTPWPFNNNAGYHIDAGQDTTIHIDSTLSLNGLIELNMTSPTYEVKWSLEDGPGLVTFSNDTSYNTAATFDTEGTYVLQFMGKDTSLLTNSKKFYTLMDYITITVENCISPITYYPDNDNDGYGDGNSDPTIICSGGTPPASGYVENDADCDDTNINDVDLVINDDPIVNGTYKANASINSMGITDNTAELITFQAGETIILNPGFVAEEGTDFIAKIETCNSSPSSLIQPIDDESVINHFTEKEEIENILLEKEQLHIYPNPTQHSLFVKRNNQKEANYFILNMVGKIIRTGKINSDFLEINVDDLNSSVYIFILGKHKLKFVKTHN